MEMNEYISKDVALSEAEMDDKRVQDRASLTYFRPFWDAYKGHVKGLLLGILIGGLLATGVGIAVAGVAGLASTAMWTTLALFSSAGALMGSQAYGDVGSASAARASGLAEKHARMLDPAYKNAPLAAIDDALMAAGHGHHYEFPVNRDRHKFFSWKSGIIGTMVGALTGALLGHAAAAGIAGAALPSMLAPVVTALGVANPVILGAICVGLFGLSFGVDRSIFKSVFNITDANNQGHLLSHKGPDLGKAQTLGKETDSGLEMHRLQRQEDMHVLTKNYNEKIFWGSLNGAFRGTAGGLVIGALLGAGVGLMAGLALPALGIIALSSTVTVGGIVAAFSGAGALFGMNTFASIGREAGAESTARSIDTEFELNRELRARGITPPQPEKVKETWFNPRTAIIMGAIGAAVGVPLVAFLGISGGVAASVVTMGLVGASYGVGTKPFHILNDGVTKLYDKSYLSGNKPQAELTAPYVAPPVHDTTITAEELAALRAHEQRTPEKSFVQSVNNTQPSLSVGM